MMNAFVFETFVMTFSLMLILIASTIMRGYTHNDRNIVVIYVLEMLTIISDLIWSMVDGNLEMIRINYLVNMIYLVSSSFIGYFYFLHCSRYATSNFWRKQSVKTFLALPSIIVSLLIITSSYTHLVLYVNSEGFYVRGPLNYLHVICSLFCCLVTLVMLLRSYKKVVLANEKDYLISLAFFPVIPIITVVLQMMSKPGLTFISYGIALALLVLFIKTQENQITRDSLTQLPNRYRFDFVVNDMVNRNSRTDKALYVFMLDIDEFKAINDTYGHLYGDEALIEVAKVINTECSKVGAFAARFGGDEFSIAFETDKEEKVALLIKKIEEGVLHIMPASNCQFSVSIGAAKLEENMTVSSLIAEADKELYKKKNAGKKKGLRR